MTTKVVCNFVLPGRTMLAPSECENSEKSDLIRQSIKIFDKKKNKVEYVNFYTRNFKDAYQSLNISDIAYDWMTGPESFFEVNMTKGEWKKMDSYARLSAHVDLIAKSLSAKSYTFEIMPD